MKEKPENYQVICVSLYNEDIELLDKLVKQLKDKKFTRANRSSVIRFALQHADVSKAKKGF